MAKPTRAQARVYDTLVELSKFTTDDMKRVTGEVLLMTTRKYKPMEDLTPAERNEMRTALLQGTLSAREACEMYNTAYGYFRFDAPLILGIQSMKEEGSWGFREATQQDKEKAVRKRYAHQEADRNRHRSLREPANKGLRRTKKEMEEVRAQLREQPPAPIETPDLQPEEEEVPATNPFTPEVVTVEVEPETTQAEAPADDERWERATTLITSLMKRNKELDTMASASHELRKELDRTREEFERFKREALTWRRDAMAWAEEQKRRRLVQQQVSKERLDGLADRTEAELREQALRLNLSAK